MAEAEAVQWCEMIWNSLREGGSWGIPRTGLIFQKQASRNALVLVKRAPHDAGLPITERRLREMQDGDFEATREHFAELGVEVLDET